MDGLKERREAQKDDTVAEAERAGDKRGNKSERVKGNDGSLGSSPGAAEQSQLGPNAPGKHREPATPNVTLHTALGSEMASQFS